MKKYIFILLLSISSICHAGQAPFKLSDLKGDWLSKEFIDNIKSSKSIINSTSPATVEILINKENNHYSFKQAFSKFHEGYISKVYDIKHVEKRKYSVLYSLEDSDYYSPHFVEFTNNANEVYFYFVNMNISKYSDKEFVFTKDLYVRVKPDMNQYVNSLILQGVYLDQQNNKFVFSKNLTAQWPMVTFNYELGLDTVFAKLDYCYARKRDSSGNNPLDFCFVWKEGKLMIYDINHHEDPWIMQKEPPKYILRPIKKSN